ncbi:hypothetical protein TeGR_g7215 [Tetraparma gracilis]|uniref:Protein kinase domain-containing protein n=1 Tax=Tetraparma gracilis TaxID=2962635 RepID=A0ABQ6MNM2_9STRA|nr:hypothetical protein TeGR_g7215 [Tetraparma gracilis]
MTISFSLDGVQIGEPVEIIVAPLPPDNTVLFMGIIFGGIIVVFGVSNWLYSKFGKRGINAKKEKEVSVDVKLRKILDSKIHAQDTMTLIEVKASYRQIIRGDDPELAKALDAADGVLSQESIAIRRSLIVLDMTVCDVGIRGFFIEDLPSILLNSAINHVDHEQTLTWKGNLWRMALEAALGVQYLHHHRYWKEEPAGWKEAVIHRDLKPDNMLLDNDWRLKLTDFGEARATNLGATMTSVGTPIYISPEVMRADHYDVSADAWSYGLCLVAMARGEKTLQEYFYECLRKHKKKRTTKGLGMGQMTKYYYSEGWRPLLPLNFVKAYPKLHALIQECWRVRRKERPTFDEIVKRLQGDIGDEIKRKEEPTITIMSKENDAVYQGRIGKEDELEDSEGEEEGIGGTTRKKQHEVAMKSVLEELRAKDALVKELREKLAQYNV